MPINACSAFLRGQCADGENCRNRHDVVRCSCGLVLLQAVYRSHYKGKPHKKAMAELAQFNLNQTAPLNTAQSQRVPRRARTFQSLSPEEKRQRQERHVAFAAFYAEAQADKENVTVSAPNGIDFGVVESGERSLTVPIKIRKTNPASRIALHKYRLTSSENLNSPTKGKWFSVELLGQNRWIINQRVIKVEFCSTGLFDGLYEDTLELLFRDIILQKNFVIVRSIASTVGSKVDQEVLKASSPYTPRRRTRPAKYGRIISCGRPLEWSATTYKAFLPEFKAPADLIEAAYGEDGRPSMSTQEFRQRFMPSEFNLKTYEAAFRTPLYIEEEKMKQDLDAYSMSGVTLAAEYPRYKFVFLPTKYIL
jgi:helicase MOV-10